MATKIVIQFSTIRGIHRTMLSSHEDVVLSVEVDDTIRHIDPQSMRVMFPPTVPAHLLHEITWPKNPKHKRFDDQLVRDCVGRKVGNVPANLAGFFRKCLLYSGHITSITCISTGTKPRPSVRPNTKEKFRKSWSGGQDRRGGGLVLDCRYEIGITHPRYREDIVHEVQKFLAEQDGGEEILAS